MRLDLIDEEADFIALAPEWDALLRSSRQDVGFLEHERLRLWWEIFGEDDDLAIVTCREDDGELVGVLPTVVARHGRAVPVKALRFMGERDIWSYMLTPFARPDVEEEVFARLREFVTSGKTPWDVVELGHMDERCAFFRSMGAPFRVSTGNDFCLRVELPKDWDTYLEQLMQVGARRHSSAKKLRQTYKRMEAAGATLETITDPEALPEALADFIVLHEERMRHVLSVGEVMSEEYWEFTRRCMERYLAEGRLDFRFMRLDGRRIAGAYCWRYGDTTYGERTGFEEGTPVRDPLRVVWAECVKSAIEAGSRYCEDMLGAHKYKLDWVINDIVSFGSARAYTGSLAGQARRLRDAAMALRDRASSGPRLPAETAETLALFEERMGSR